MIYRDFQGEKISALGFGTMRLPLKSDSDSDVDGEIAGIAVGSVAGAALIGAGIFFLIRRRRKV